MSVATPFRALVLVVGKNQRFYVFDQKSVRIAPFELKIGPCGAQDQDLSFGRGSRASHGAPNFTGRFFLAKTNNVERDSAAKPKAGQRRDCSEERPITATAKGALVKS